MQLQVKGKNMPVTDALFEHAERKLQRLTRVLPPWDEAALVELELSVERNPKIDRSQVAEITVRTKGPVLRVREGAQDMYLAIDQAARKLERQAVRYRERRRRHRSPHEGEPPPPAVLDEALPGGSAPDDGTTPSPDAAPRLVKTKTFPLKPMSADEAALHMDMLHHDFYVFRSSDTGEVNVVYRRRDGDFGLIEPD
jgi:putative sigma-54 modulation protein